jgi:hypothetical protein
MGSSRKIRGDIIGINAKTGIIFEPVPGTYGLIGCGIERYRFTYVYRKGQDIIIRFIISP